MAKPLSMSVTIPVPVADIELLLTELQDKAPPMGLAHPIENYLHWCSAQCNVRAYLSQVYGVDISEDGEESDG